MREIILVVSYWLHSVAMVVWIGGIFFILFVALPSAKHVLGAETGRLMGEISKRFTPMANYSIIALIVTGIVLTATNKQFSEIGNFRNGWTSVLIIKHLLVAGMVAVHFYRALVLVPKIVKMDPSSKKVSLQKLSLDLIKVNFSLGLVVLVFSGIISIMD